MKDTFLGYPRPDDRFGVRNHVLVLSTVTCANHVVEEIARAVNAVPVVHTNGCLQLGSDLALTKRTIVGCAQSPNVGAVLLVGLGCEQTVARDLAAQVTTKPCEVITIQGCGGTRKAIATGIEKARRLQSALTDARRVECPVSSLRVGLKCGGSDYTSALTSNPAVGRFSDLLVAAGGGPILTETTSFPGSEHVLANKAANCDVARDIYRILDFYQDEIEAHFQMKFSDGNPSPGNKDGGITTLAEKSIGSLKKAGSTTIQGVVGFAEDVSAKSGLWIMDTPGHDVFSVSGPAAGGCQITIFTTGRGSPLGNPIMPVIKVCGNPRTFEALLDDMDLNAGKVMLGECTLDEMGAEMFQMVLEVASGSLTKAELNRHYEFAIPRIGSTL